MATIDELEKEQPEPRRRSRWPYNPNNPPEPNRIVEFCPTCHYSLEHCKCSLQDHKKITPEVIGFLNQPKIVAAASHLGPDPRTTVMGPTRLRPQSPADTYSRWKALPAGKEFKCQIRHTGTCTCQPPVIVRPDMEETCNSSIMYMLSVLKKDPLPDRGLQRSDLDFLAWSVSKIAGHWGRLALGQQDLI